MDSQKPPVIIVRRKGGHGHGHHGGAWKVAYADFVTAMMAFFMVLWLVNQTPEVRSAVASYMRDPLADPSNHAGGAGILGGSTAALEPPVPGQDPPSTQQREAIDQLQNKAEDLLHALMQLPDLAGLAGQIEVELTPEGLRVQLMESEKGTFFDSGSPALSGKGVEALVTVANVLGSLKHDMAVEGHTDSKPFAGAESYSNWELSVDRANSARRILEKNGIDPSRFKAVRGYAATRPRLPGQSDDPRNRRIAIIVMRDGAIDAGEPPEVHPSALTS